MVNTMTTASEHAQALLTFIDDSPSPWHAVASCEQLLLQAGYGRLLESQRWSLQPGGRYYVTRGDASIIAFQCGNLPLADAGLRIIGAHTDSPGLRIKPKPVEDVQGVTRLGVEVYGGPILATFSDRELSLAGRVVSKTETGLQTQRVRFEQPLLRLPNLAIHMNRLVNEEGLKFNKQTELPLVLGMTDPEADPELDFRCLIADQLQLNPAAILSWELNAYDTQPGSLWGVHSEFLASSQLDNLASCHAALSALLQAPQTGASCICAFFDHEEVGSESSTGAGGSFLQDVMQRMAASQQLDAQDRQRMHANSFFISADMAHAWHPNFPAAYDAAHHALVNAGPVIKLNSNQRYSSNAETAARFMLCCEQAKVPYQQYVHRTDLGCGSTIGPMLAAQLGMASVDVGNAMWAMHSIRESAGVLDHDYLTRAFVVAFTR